MSNKAKIPWNTQKTPAKHVLRLFEKFLKNPVLGWKIRFSAQISNYAKIPWNTQKTPTKHVLRLLKKFVKIRFSAQTSNSRLRCRNAKNTLKLRKHQLNMFWGFLIIFWKSGSRLKKSGSRTRCRTMLKILWNTQKTPTKHALILNNLLANSWKSGSLLKNPVLCYRCRTMLKNTMKHSENTT